jgi:hypothetical protein
MPTVSASDQTHSIYAQAHNLSIGFYGQTHGFARQSHGSAGGKRVFDRKSS